jgi:DNA-binding response OmpR family regulator
MFATEHRPSRPSQTSPANKHLVDDNSADGIRMLRTHILLVDDEQEILDLLTELLSENGYLVDTAGTVEEAVRLLDNNAYALVISDWRLPDGDGLLIADTAAVLGAKTILVSGHLSEMRGGRADAHETIMKPFKLDEFLYAVKGALGKE